MDQFRVALGVAAGPLLSFFIGPQLTNSLDVFSFRLKAAKLSWQVSSQFNRFYAVQSIWHSIVPSCATSVAVQLKR